jgi:hypothetical protein
MTQAVVAVVADDLIWSDRLHRLVAAGGARVAMCRSEADLEAALPSVDAVLVDLSARSFDPHASIDRAARASVRVLAVGPHDAHDVRERARASGAERVLAYRALAESGREAIDHWLAADPDGQADD